jgi:hypothetical protein
MAKYVHNGTKWSLIIGDVHPRIELGMNTTTKYLGMTSTKHLEIAFF